MTAGPCAAAHPGARGARAVPASLSRLPHRLPLRDGRSVWLRPVRAGDAEAERAFVAALSPASRRRRFHGAIAQLPAAVAQAMTGIDFRRHVALVAEARADDGAMQLVADARYVCDETDERSAEFAIAVADRWQGVGLGRLLLWHLGGLARRSGIETLRGSVLADNAPMLALMHSVGARARADPHDAGLLHVVARL